MEFDNFDSRPLKSWNFGLGPGRSWNLVAARLHSHALCRNFSFALLCKSNKSFVFVSKIRPKGN